jgi:hypothetical protein
MNVLKITCDNWGDVEPFLGNLIKYTSTTEGSIEVILGWGLAKNRGANILNPKINENTYWSFLPREKMDLFKKNITDFILIAYNNLISDIKIINLNPLEYEDKNDFLFKIKQDLIGGTTYLYSDRLYTYINNTIYHIDMGLLTFMSWDLNEEIIQITSPIKINEKDFKDDLKYLDKKYIPFLVNAKENIITSNIR